MNKRDGGRVAKIHSHMSFQPIAQISKSFSFFFILESANNLQLSFFFLITFTVMNLSIN